MWARFRFLGWPQYAWFCSLQKQGMSNAGQPHTHTRQSLHGLVIYASSLSRRINYTLDMVRTGP